MYGPEKALDGNLETYWAVDDGIKKATLEIDTEGPLGIHAVEICEAPGFEGRVSEYKVEGQIQSDWKLLSQGTRIGKSKIDEFPKETVWKVKLTITNMTKFPAISAFRIFVK
jgi:alpha-L-fucosidase